jgi:DNA-binding MarR family transcriptional regulator
MESNTLVAAQKNSPLATIVWKLTLKLSKDLLIEAAAQIEAVGIEAKEFFVLDAVTDQPYPAELAKHLSMPKPTVTLYLKNLEAHGFIGRVIDRSDLRRHRLELTPLGRKTVTQSRAILTACYAKRLNRLSESEQRDFATLLEKLT